MKYFIAFCVALALTGVAGAIIAYIYHGDPDAVDDECSRVDDAANNTFKRSYQ